jgi:hypothetical protein
MREPGYATVSKTELFSPYFGLPSDVVDVIKGFAVDLDALDEAEQLTKDHLTIAKMPLPWARHSRYYDQDSLWMFVHRSPEILFHRYRMGIFSGFSLEDILAWKRYARSLGIRLSHHHWIAPPTKREIEMDAYFHPRKRPRRSCNTV